MGYEFTFDKPSAETEPVRSEYALSNDQMNYVRLALLEASAIDGDGYRAADRSGLPVTGQTLPAGRFDGVGGYVSAAEAAFIAERLRQAVAQGMMRDLLDFLDDHPGVATVRTWVEGFAELNERAAQRHGYHIV